MYPYWEPSGSQNAKPTHPLPHEQAVVDREHEVGAAVAFAIVGRRNRKRKEMVLMSGPPRRVGEDCAKYVTRRMLRHVGLGNT